MTANRHPAAVSTFIRTSGFLFFLFGLLAVILRIVQFLILGDPPLEILALDPRFPYLQGVPSLFAAIFFLSGATALYLYQADHIGRLGLAVYFLAFSLLVLSTGAMWAYAFTTPALAREAPNILTSMSSDFIQAVLVSLALGQIGWLALLLVSLRTGVVPRIALVVAILSICAVIVLTPFAQNQFVRFVYNILLGTGPLVIGYVLWKIRPISS